MELKLELDPARMPIAVAFAESAARSAGFADRECSLLALSVEEVFMALCCTMPGRPTELRFSDLRHAAEVCFRFQQAPPDLTVFNITARPDHDSEEGMASMGLFLASRACEQFSVRRREGGDWEIRLRKERAYPAPGPEEALPDRSVKVCRLNANADPDSLRQLSRLITDHYGALQFPEQFTPAGRLLDKVASGRYGAVTALGDQGELAGGLIWHDDHRRIVECYGPYLGRAADPDGTVEQLCDHLSGLHGRSDCLGLAMYAPRPLPPSSGFEPAGQLDTPAGLLWAGYRMLTEEFGATARVPEEWRAFYEERAEAMALAREIRTGRDEGESGDGATLFSVRLDRGAGMAFLLPLLVGRDAGEVLAEHLRQLDAAGFAVIHFALDTGQPYGALLSPHLAAQGFTPGMLIPWGGRGDRIVLQRLRKRP